MLRAHSPGFHRGLEPAQFYKTNPNRNIRIRVNGVVRVGVVEVQTLQEVIREMTKSKKALIAGAALAGLLAGTSATIQASNLLPGLRAAAQADQAPADKKGKEKHACKG